METTVYRSLAQLDAMADLWDSAAPQSPHAARSLYTLVARTARDKGTEPYVIVLSEPGREPILVVGRIERAPLRVKAGYRTLLSVPVRWLTVVAGGVVGARTPDDHGVVLAALRDALRRGEADLVEFAKLDVTEPLHEFIVGRVPRPLLGRATAPQRHHRALLGNGFEAYEAARSRNTRQRNRRRLRKLESPGFELRRVGSQDDAAVVAKVLDEITAHSYQRGIGAGFELDELHQTLVEWAVDGGPFRIWTLSVNGVPAAYVSGLVHGRTFFLFDTAFDPAYSDDEPGAVLMAAVVHELAQDPGIDAFDLAFGDAQYKQSLADESWDEVDLLVFAARPRPLALNALRAAAAGAVATAKRVLGGERIAALRRRRRAELTG